ncbi:MAG: dephospho-CoA kinase [Gammaproteobacteria bacterium]|nr:dephospho-CoA kinase [Gammaproteobacteria bacterium]
MHRYPTVEEPATLLKIGLTGGIGSGKSTASEHFARLGAAVIDTDLLSRELVEPGQAALDEIVAAFGAGVLDADGRLDRARLRDIVFGDAAARRRLEGILHPRIRAEMLRRAAAADAPYVVFVIPLLFETAQQALVDRVLVVDVPPALQRARVLARDGGGYAQVDAILAAQVDRVTRLRLADDVIRNDGSIAELQAQVEALHDRYRDQVED